MKLNQKLQNIILVSVMAIGIIGLVLGTLYDQQITAKVANEDNILGILLTAFGIFGSLFVGCYACAVLFFNVNLKNNTANTILRIIAALTFIIINFFEIKESIKYADYPRMVENAASYKTLMIVFVILVDLAIIIFSKTRTSRFDKNAIVPVCLTIMIIIICFSGASECSKYLVSRPRPRIVELGEVSFRNWYEFKPFLAFKDGYKDCKSFVSGHAANSMCCATLFPLVLTLRKGKTSNSVQLMAAVVGVLYSLVIAFSRVLANAHYFTDIMGGIIGSIIIQLIVYNVAVKIVKKIKIA